MNETMKALADLIEKQRKGHENAPRWMIGEQLLEIAGREPTSAELLLHDLTIKEMDLEAAEQHFQKYADEHHKGGKSFCITPKVAEDLLRKFYGLQESAANDAGSPAQKAPEADGFIDLSAFL